MKAKYIFLMDIGTAGFTEYETDTDIVDMYDNVEDAMDLKIGHIHTHHTMSTFFSGTDNEELQDNVDKHNYYLSLIVNFASTYSAKVAFLSDVHTHSKMSYVNDKGNKSHFKTDKVGKTMVLINMSIQYEYNDDFFYKRYAQVKEKTKTKVVQQDDWKKNWENRNNGKSLPMGATGAPPDADPTDMKDFEVERLTRNILSFSVDLREVKSVYAILFAVNSSTEEEKGIYYQYLAQNVEEVIQNFFDQELEVDEMKVVIREVRDSIARFSTYTALESLTDNIDLTLEEFVALYESMKTDEDMEDAIKEETGLLDAEIIELEEKFG